MINKFEFNNKHKNTHKHEIKHKQKSHFYRSCRVFFRRSPPLLEKDAAWIFTLIFPSSSRELAVWMGRGVDMFTSLLESEVLQSRGPKTVAKIRVFPIS